MMDAPTRSCLSAIADEATRDEKAILKTALGAAASTARSVAGHWAFEAPSKAIDLWISTMFPEHRDDTLIRIRKAIVARLALAHFQAEDKLAPSVVALYPAFFDRLAQFLSHRPGRGYRPGFYCKDVRYALGLTIPCGSLQIDLRYRIGPKLVLRDIVHSGSPQADWDYVSSSVWGRWYNTHLDPREMGDFNPAGWTASFSRIADMLEINRQVRGAAGVSWYYDPKVSEISPELAYLRRNQIDNGAFSLWLGPGPEHTKNAVFASRIRQRLYEKGKYLPTAFLIAWPRRDLIRWARSAATAAEWRWQPGPGAKSAGSVVSPS